VGDTLWQCHNGALETGSGKAVGKAVFTFFMRAAWLVPWIGILALGGCATTPPVMTPPLGENLSPDTSAVEAQSEGKDLAAARGFIKAGNYSQAIPRLSHVTANSPDSAEAMEAHFMLGQTYYELGGYREAMEHFQRCLKMSPDGPFASWCGDYLKRLTDSQGNPYAQPEFAEKRITEMKALTAAHPEELAYQLDLAELYWKGGHYADAGGVYNRVFLQWPKLVNDMVLRQRIEWSGDGKYTVLTPDEVLRRHSEEDPLLITGATSYRSGRYAGHTQSFRETQYNVTGKAVNRSKTHLQNVRLSVTIYGLGATVYETQTVTVGNLAPGAARAFSAVFTQFDDINNVARYEIQGDFERRQK